MPAEASTSEQAVLRIPSCGQLRKLQNLRKQLIMSFNDIGPRHHALVEEQNAKLGAKSTHCCMLSLEALQTVDTSSAI